jgi:glycerophosphoryl diester phosphodiesterase
MNFKNIYASLISAVCLLTGCIVASHMTVSKNNFDFQAHRGGRGLMPENTIPAMLAVMDNDKVTTLEMDLAVTKDKQVVVSHDPTLNPIITSKADGTYIKANEFTIYQMNYDQLQKFDVGLKIHPVYPQQKKLAVAIPTLNDLVDSVEMKGNNIGRKMFYNIEIKSVDGKDIVEHPVPEEFVALVVNLITQKKINSRTTIQSFDLRPLKVLHDKYPRIQIAYLVEGKSAGDVKMKIDLLGFTPNIYSPEYKYVTKETVDYCHANNMKIIPWTVNTKTEMDAMITMGVDGLITDYPNLVR